MGKKPGGRRLFALLLGLWLPFFSAQASFASGDHNAFAENSFYEYGRKERALLIGIDYFVSKPTIYPSSTNNVYAMQEIFQSAQEPLETLLIPAEPVTSANGLTALIQDAFGEALPQDVSYFYISTHGDYAPESGEDPVLLLSDGLTEYRMSAAELEAAFSGIAGKKVLILDACNSGAFIGKGEVAPPHPPHFLGNEFKVLTSSGALEESWYWGEKDAEAPAQEADSRATGRPPPPDGQGSFYFTQSLLQSLSPRYGYPADGNLDGMVTLTELYEYLLQNHAPSTPQVYPQHDDFVFFRYDIQKKLMPEQTRSPILHVNFSGTMLDQKNQEVILEYVATRPVRVGYQIVYFQDGKWSFEDARILFNAPELFTAFGDQPGAVSAGHKMQALTSQGRASYGYMMVQLVSFDNGKITVHAGRVFCLPPQEGTLQLGVTVQSQYDRSGGQELSIFATHNYPCALSVAVINQQGEVVRRIAHNQSTRPSQIKPTGSLFYWNGTDKYGDPVPSGLYQVRISGTMNGETFTALSGSIALQ